MLYLKGDNMPRKKKKEEIIEEPTEVSEEEQYVVVQQQGELSPVALRLQLLGLSKEILEHQSHLTWETHTKFIDVSVENVIDGARELLDFVCEVHDE